MDALGSLLNGPRARDPLVLRMVFASPWALQVDDRSPLTVLVVTRGSMAVDHDGARSIIATGEVALFRGTEPYLLSDGVHREPIARIDENGDCVDLGDHHSVAQQMSVGVRSWGNCAPEDADTAMIVGVYRAGEVSRALLEALPQLTVVPMSDDPLRALMEAEVIRAAPGQDAILNRYLDLLLITALRRTFDSDATISGGAAWVRAYRDREVGRALRLLHNNVEEPWTVDSLAREVGLSRATLARRFTELVGEPPMKHLTSWRLALAADLLAEDKPDTLAVIADRTGYTSPFALSTAFKREYGVSPSHWRSAQ
ncbi:AraC family transcriptional regulator [Gordonia sp. X0973]|uniref:AraC family transcriptional regulator n=1 Tax=Gordonia sp. X0973 TaxID=2742602 RepID=UPI000F52C26F|nr:AraC family transcriptional regulator [Gordonia sp. X0973]QKT06239.1 AraC family transcriptional regulator [Gordonia sp. X0973]